MIRNIKAKNHKGINSLILKDLGPINIICGKNNSGKTSILEAINNAETRAIGRKLSDADLDMLSGNLNAQADRLSSPPPGKSKEFIKFLLNELKADATMWFSDNKDTLHTKMKDYLKHDDLGKRHGDKILHFTPFTDKLFSEELSSIKPVLIPPKRRLSIDTPIHSGAELNPDGSHLTQRLFFLKNQPQDSPDYKTYMEIKEAFNLVTGHDFDITTPQHEHIRLYFQGMETSWISADAWGLGLLDILTILSFVIDFDYNLILIEEPENHLHPEYQRRLLSFLRERSDKQFVLTTHSNVFLNNAYVDKVFFSYFENRVKIDDATSRASILDDLGYDVTDNLISDLVILVEGPSDGQVLEEYLLKMGIYNSYIIKIWPLGGDIMNQLDLSVFSQSYNMIGLIDSDPGSRKVRTRFMEKCDAEGIEVHKLKGYAIENYFSLRALGEVFSSQIPESITEIKPKEKLERQIGIDVKKNNRKLAQAMTLEEVEGTDLHDFLIRVNEKCETQSN